MTKFEQSNAAATFCIACLLVSTSSARGCKEHANHASVWTEQIDRDLRPFRAGITSQKVDQSARLGDFRIVIKDNALYVGPGKSSAVNVADLDHAVLMMIAKSLCYHKTEDVDFVLNLGDSPLLRSNTSGDRLPMLSWSRGEGYDDIFFPYWSFTWLHPVPASFQQPEWALKRNIAVWRGSTTGGIWTEPLWRNLTRAKLSRMCNARPDLCDAKINGYVQGGETIQETIRSELGSAPEMTTQELCAHKYIIVVEGNGPASSRLVHLLRHCRSVLLVQETPLRLFWMAEFQPFVHYVPIAENLEDLYDRIEWARRNEDIAQRIATNAHEFALKHLNDGFVSRYVNELFRTYAGLLKFDVQVPQDMHRVPASTDGWHHFFQYMGGRCQHLSLPENN